MAGKAGVAKDERKARELFARACAGGDKLGCAAGDVPEETIRPDDRWNVRFLSAACDASLGLGCAILGAAYADGSYGLPKNPQLAAQSFEKGCEAGSSGCCIIASAARLDGKGVPRDEAKGLMYMQRACSLGQGRACGVMGTAHNQGAYGLREDHKAAVALFELGCKLGDSDSCEFLAVVLAEGDGVAQDAERAKRLLETGCQRNTASACGRLGAFLYQGGQRAEGLRMLQKACGLGSEVACNAWDTLLAAERR